MGVLSMMHHLETILINTMEIIAAIVMTSFIILLFSPTPFPETPITLRDPRADLEGI